MLRDVVLPHDAILVVGSQRAEFLRNHGDCSHLVLETETAIRDDRRRQDPEDVVSSQPDFADRIAGAIRFIASRRILPGVVILVDPRPEALAYAVQERIHGAKSQADDRKKSSTMELSKALGNGGRGRCVSTFVFVVVHADGEFATTPSMK